MVDESHMACMGGLVMVDLRSKPQTKKVVEAKRKSENGNRKEADKCLQG